MAIISKMIPNRSYFDDMFDNFMFRGVNGSDFGNMRCDIYELDNVYHLEMDIPGFDKDDINIEIDDNDYLTITAFKNNENTEEDSVKNYIRKERNYGKYQRSFYIGGIDKENVEANFLNGILKIKIPKRLEEKALTKRIEIN